LKKIEDSLFEANRLDRFDEKIKNLTPIERSVIDAILNTEIDEADDSDIESHSNPNFDKNRAAKGVFRDS